jgi:hypothetical protein
LFARGSAIAVDHDSAPCLHAVWLIVAFSIVPGASTARTVSLLLALAVLVLGVCLGLQGRHLVSIRRLPPWYQLGLGHDERMEEGGRAGGDRLQQNKLFGKGFETPWKKALKIGMCENRELRT